MPRHIADRAMLFEPPQGGFVDRAMRVAKLVGVLRQFRYRYIYTYANTHVYIYINIDIIVKSL